MSTFRDAADNIRDGLVSAWDGMSAEAKAFCLGMALGTVCGGVAVGLWAL